MFISTDVRDNSILDYARDGYTAREISEKLEGMLTPEGVRSVCRRNGVTCGVAIPGRVPNSGYSILTKQHEWVGVQLNAYARGRTIQAVAEDLRVSFVVLRRMYDGRHDFTLLELHSIADKLGTPFLELITPPRPICAIPKEIGKK